MAGYTRQDTSNNIATGNVIDAADLDNEFNAIAATYSVTTGHKHDGTASEGPPITRVGPNQEVSVNSTSLYPKSTASIDLGTSLLKFQTAYIETATLTAGTVGGSAIVTLSGTQTLTNKSLTSPALTGTPTAPTATAGTNTTQVATTAFVFAERTNAATLTNKILTSPTISAANLTGVPVAPTATAGTNTTQVATTAFVIAERTSTATLTNKTLTSPTISNATSTGASISGASISSSTITGSTLTGIYTGTYTIPANGTVILPFDTSPVIRITPNASGTFTTTAPAAGTLCTLIILTSGTTSYTMTFSNSGFRTTGTLATGTASNRYFVLQFISNGNNLIEVSRTAAITA